MKTKTMSDTNAANTNHEGANVIAQDPSRSRMEKLGERLTKVASNDANSIGLANHNWPPEKTLELQRQIEGLVRVHADQAEAKRVVAEAALELALVVQAAAANRDRLANGLRLFALRSQVVVPAMFLKVANTTDNSDLLRSWLKIARRYTTKVLPQMTLHMGVDPLAVIDDATASLLKSSRALKVARVALRKANVQAQEDEGDTMVSINSLLYVARTAFRDSPSLLLQFRKYNGVRRPGAAKPASSKEQPKAEAPKAEDTKAEEAKSAKTKAA